MGKNDSIYGGKSKKDWENCGFKTPAVAKAWVDNGFTDPAVAKAWVDNGFTDPAVAKAWVDNGFMSPYNVYSWVYTHFTDPAVAKAWVDNGFTSPYDAHSWVKAGFTDPAVAKIWADNGFKNSSTAKDWVDNGFTDPAVAKIWADNGFKLTDKLYSRYPDTPSAPRIAAANFKRLGFSPQDAGPWFLGLCVKPKKNWIYYIREVADRTLDWMHSGFTDPKIVCKWLDAGVSYPIDARTWVENFNIDINNPERVRTYRYSKGGPPVAWAKELGTTDLKTIRDWQAVFGEKGVDDARSLSRQTGIKDLSQLLATAKIWVKAVGSTKSALEWLKYGVTDPSIARNYVINRLYPYESSCWRNRGYTDPEAIIKEKDKDSVLSRLTAEQKELLLWLEKFLRKSGFDPSDFDLDKDILKWYDKGITDPKDIKQWYIAGVKHPEKARNLQLAGVTPQIYKKWKVFIKETIHSGKSYDEALSYIERWMRVGLGPEEVDLWQYRRGTLEEAESWKKAGLDVKAAAAWTSVARTLDEVKVWMKSGLDLKTAEAWHPIAKTPGEIKGWMDAGLRVKTATAWLPVAKTPGEIKGWMKNGFNLDQAKAWIKIDGDLDTALAWKAAGFGFAVAEICARRGIGLETAKKRGFNDPDIISKSKAWSAAGLDFVVKYYCDQYSVDLNEAIEIGFGYQDGSTTIKKRIIKFKQYIYELEEEDEYTKIADFAVKQKDGLVMMQYGDLDPTPDYVINPKGLQKIIVQAVSKKALMAAEKNNSDGFIILRFPKTVQKITIAMGVTKALSEQINKHHCYMKLIIWTTKQGISPVFMEGNSGPMQPVNSIPGGDALKKISVLHVNNKDALKSLRRFK